MLFFVVYLTNYTTMCIENLQENCTQCYKDCEKFVPDIEDVRESCTRYWKDCEKVVPDIEDLRESCTR